VALSAFVSCHTADERAAGELAGRIVPDYARNIRFVQIEDTVDVFELSMYVVIEMFCYICSSY
jgi:hypothetical protein